MTLGYVTDHVSAEGNPIIAPYPNWEWNTVRTFGQCNGIISVWRMQVTKSFKLGNKPMKKLENNKIAQNVTNIQLLSQPDL